MERLAIEGGTPVREKKLYYGRQWIEEDDIRAVTEVLRGDYLTTGPHVAAMERALERYTGARHAVAVSSGTAALHCACLAAGIGPGDEVITTPITFAASANCALYCGARPVFADVDPETYSIDPASVEAHITPRTRAVVAVDFAGQAVRVRELRDVCARHGLVFIEDAAHSIGTRYDGRMVGALADMTCMSFHPVKTVTSGEGGAILTDDDALYEKLILFRAHGITHEADRMEAGPEAGPWYYEQVTLGYNYRITDFQAALLVSQLGKIDRFAARRKELTRRYDEAFAPMPELHLQRQIPQSDTCRHLYILRLDQTRLDCDRRTFFEAMAAENVQCQIHYIPVYWFPYYRRLGYEKGLCPNAEAVYQDIVSIPLYPAMTDGDADDVITAVRKVVRRYRREP